MPNAEQSFADRLDRGKTLQTHIAAFTPAFLPPDSAIDATNFGAYLSDIENTNTDLGTAEATYNPLLEQRFTAAEGLRATALRVKDYIGANALLKKYHTAIARAADAVRGYRPAKKKVVPAEGEPAAPVKKAAQGARSQKGFADLANLFGKLVSQVTKVIGYTATAGSGLTVTELGALKDAFTTLDDSITTAETDLSTLQRTRKALYDGESGLREKIKSIKKAVRAQYGITSPEYTAIKGIAT